MKKWRIHGRSNFLEIGQWTLLESHLGTTCVVSDKDTNFEPYYSVRLTEPSREKENVTDFMLSLECSLLKTCSYWRMNLSLFPLKAYRLQRLQSAIHWGSRKHSVLNPYWSTLYISEYLVCLFQSGPNIRCIHHDNCMYSRDYPTTSL